MNENINLVEILKNAPMGTKLWSPLCGECSLYRVDMSSEVPIIVEVKRDENNEDCILRFAANGKYFNRLTSAECLLFPSKQNRDWLTFKPSQKHKHFEPGQKVLVPYYDCNNIDYNNNKWRLTFYSHYDKSSKHHITTCGIYWLDNEILLYKGNEDKLGRLVAQI